MVPVAALTSGASAVAKVSRTVGVGVVAPRPLRVLAQVAVLVVVLAASPVPVHAVALMVLAQLAIGAGVHALHRSARVHRPVARTLRVWWVGAALALLVVPPLAAAGISVATAQVAVVAGVLVVGALGVARDHFNAAGRALDDILATLPPEGLASHEPPARVQQGHLV